MRPLLLINPIGINLDWHVKTFEHDLDIGYLRYLLHHVISGMAFSIENDEKLEKGNEVYTPISSKKVIYPHKLREHIRFLGERWIGDINYLFRTNYSDGKCYSYTLSPYYRDSYLETFEVKSSVLARKVKAKSTYITDEVNKVNGNYHYLKKYFNNKYLTIDIDLALKLCKERYDNHDNFNKYIKEFTQIVNLHNGIYRINHKPETDGRIHTNLTSIPKVYRKFIKYKSKQLAEVDLSNSVIYFIAMCLSNKVNDLVLKKFSLLYMFIESLGGIDDSEVKLFNKLAVSGDFYDYFVPEFLKHLSVKELSEHYSYFYDDSYDGSSKHNRNVVKRLLLSMLFAKNGVKKIEEQIFKSKFPTILKVIHNFKVRNGYKKFSHMVFQFEAEIMLSEAGRAFNKKYYRVAPLYTLHDCLITTSDYIPQLEKLMIEKFENQFGDAPKMKAKEWV